MKKIRGLTITAEMFDLRGHFMRQAIAVSFTLAVLVGCTSDPGNDTNSTGKSAGPNAPTLQAIGTKTIIAGDTLNFSVSASDSANRALVLTSDGSVGNGPDPYLEGAGFSSNSGTGNFTWPTNSETISYDYQIQFSATNSAGFSDSETITIRVQTNSNLYNQGRNTFTGNCVGSTCHRDLGSMARLVSCG